jgi:hypothetical protein
MRTGVLSDLAIKSAYPEYQPLNIGLSQAVESVVFDKHELVGVRLPKNYNPKRVPRFPINDLNNFSTLSSAPNKSKQVYTSIQSYRKKLGSSNVDTEERQSMRPRITAANEPVAFMSNNFELKMRGGVADKIKGNAFVSQADIYANTKKIPHDKIIEANKSIRTEGAKMASVERRINIENLDNFTNATKTAQEKRETDYGNYLTSEFVRTNGGELYYNYLTTRDYHARRNPDKHHEGYSSKEMTLTYNVDLRRKDDFTSKELMDYDPTLEYLQQMKREATQTRDQLNKEIGKGKSIPAMDNEDTEITATEEYSSKTEKPFVVSKNEKPMKQEDVDKMEAQMTIDPNEPVLSKSKASQNDPKRIPDNLAEFIKQREEAKMQDPAYQQETDDYLTDRSKLKQQKRIDEVELTPTKYKEKYGVSLEQKRRDTERQREHTTKTPSESSGLGQQLRNKRGDIAQHYMDYYQNEIAPTLSHREAMTSYYVAERERVYDEREAYDAMYDEAFGTNPF